MRILVGTFFVVVLLSACTKFDSLKLTHVDAEIIPKEDFNEEGFDIEEDADDVPALLIYTLEFKNNNFTSIGQSNIEAYIEPGPTLKKTIEGKRQIIPTYEPRWG